MQNCVIWLDIRSDRADSDVLRAVLYLIVIGGTAQSKNPLFFYFEKKNGFEILHVRYQKNTRGVR